MPDPDAGGPGGGDGGDGGGIVPGTGQYAVFATGTTNRCQGIEMSGSTAWIAGGLRTNGSVGLYVGALSMSGTLSYGVAIQPGSQQGSDVVHDPSPIAANLPYDLEALLAGDVPAGIAVHRHTRSVVLGSKPAKGIHLVQGGVTLPGSRIDLEGVTVIATGVINVSGSSMIASPAAPGLPSLATTSDSCGGAAINLSGSESTWNGAIVAPNGLVRASGSQVTGRGMVVGAAVRLSAAAIELGHQQQSRQPAVPQSTTAPSSVPSPDDAPLGTHLTTPVAALPVPARSPGASRTAVAPPQCPVDFPDLGMLCLR